VYAPPAAAQASERSLSLINTDGLRKRLVPCSVARSQEEPPTAEATDDQLSPNGPAELLLRFPPSHLSPGPARTLRARARGSSAPAVAEGIGGSVGCRRPLRSKLGRRSGRRSEGAEGRSRVKRPRRQAGRRQAERRFTARAALARPAAACSCCVLLAANVACLAISLSLSLAMGQQGRLSLPPTASS
jgi:hypothetical protein